MENNIRFRNHASVILENSLKTIWTVIFIFLLNFVSEIGESGIQSKDILLLVAVLILGIGIVIGIHAIIWSRTYITIEENTLVVERNTLNKKRNTIGLKSVSNVNLEQNVLEMVLGTCKIKLDTNSLSTADQTDVNIVLKKADAERFRSLVLRKSEGQEVSINDLSESVEEFTTTQSEEENLLIGDLGDIILHGLYSVRIWSIVVLIVFFVIQISMIIDMGIENLGETFMEVASSIIAAYWVVLVIIWSLVKEFIKYIGFKIQRKKDKVYLSYGLIKKVAYSVPVDKINGIRLTQTLIGRMAKRYMVEIINVGMDDDENETSTFFLPYSKLETIQKQLHILLPEFDGAIEIKEEKQPKEIWLLSIPWLLLYIIVVVIAYIMVKTYMPKSDLENAVLLAAAVLFIWRTIMKVARFLTRGIKVDENFLKIVDGGFGKRTLFVKYDKIQYVTGKQCIIAKHYKIQKGTILLLASMKNRIHELPYFKEIDMEQLKNKLI